MKNTTLVYIERDDEYLMLHRVKKENDINRDKWIGLGGKFEADESPEECMLREVYEESGLKLNSWRYRGIVTFVNTVCEGEYMHLFTSDDYSGELTECSEGVPEWIKRSKLFELELWEGDKIFLRLLETDEPFFSLKLCYDGDRLTSAKLNNVNI